MNKSSGFIKLTGLLFIVILLGALIGIMATRRAGEVPPPVVPVENPEPLVKTAPPVNRTNSPVAKPLVTTASTQPTNSTIASVTATNTLPDWEDRLDDILGNDDEDKVKTAKLLELLPRMPEEGQEETARHLANLVEDADYAPLGKILTNATFPESVLDVLLQDALNRPNELKMPLLLDVAKEAGHPKAEEAKDLLELFLDEDYGTDWAKWQSEMQKWLKNNPE